MFVVSYNLKDNGGVYRKLAFVGRA